jgi:hypothetical protein
MKMKIVLTRKINTETWEILGEMGEEQKREFFRSLAILIDNAEQLSRKALANSISVELLDRKNSSYGYRLLDRFKEFGGIDEENGYISLTYTGKELISSGNLVIPREDVFEIRITKDDALVSPYIIAYRPIGLDASNDLRAKVDNLNRKSRGKTGKDCWELHQKEANTAMELPEYVINLGGSINYSLLDGVKIRVFRINSTGFKGRKSIPVSLFVEFLPEGRENTWVEEKEGKIYFKPEDIDYYGIYEELLSQSNFQYEPKIAGLLLHYEEVGSLSISELNSFKMNVKIKNPELEDYGKFDDILIKNVIIQPLDEDAAKIWAEAILIDKIQDYLEPPEYGKFCLDIANQFTFNINLPSWEEIPSHQLISKEQYWYLQAKRDLRGAI